MPIRAGELTERVTLTPKTQSRGDGGAAVETAGTTVTVWAKVEDGGGSEGLRGGGILARQGVVFTIRKREIDPTWRVGWRSRSYEIENIAEPPEGRNEYLVISATVDEAGSN